MRLRVRLRRERVPLERTWKRVKQPTRSGDYIRLRFYWITELYYLRAKRRNGTATIKDIKAAQRALAKVRKDEQ